MKIDSIEITSGSGLSIVSYLDTRARTDRYVLTGATGLSVDEIQNLGYTATIGNTYTRFQSMAPSKRVMVFKFRLNPKWELMDSYSSLRDHLYKMISGSRDGRVTVAFRLGPVVVAEALGSVAKFENDLFSNNQEVTLTIECQNAIFSSPESVLVDTETMPSGTIQITDSLSTAPHGLYLRGVCVGEPFPYFAIVDEAYTWMFWLSLSSIGGFIAGDIITISNVGSDKHISLERDGNTYNVAQVLLPSSVWPMIFPGENSFVHSGTVDWEEVSYKHTYWGV